ncbi:DUF2252 domain-containing protein [Telmatobacter bradus]|uniref:DUF2252 domain-containing protein n=1 Tax=Telmatobacter bradus TaxID=474953 RepID=UPI003B431AAE
MEYRTAQERRALGQARRKQVGRQQHGEAKIKTRTATALELVELSIRDRVKPLVALKYQRMAESPFGYFRGAVPVMAADLAALPTTGLLAQLCGDAHVRNLGAYAAPDGRLVFDLNDFDETIRGPFEWDLKRMAASLVLAGREAGHKESAARHAAELCIAHYCAEMRALAMMPMLEVARHQVHGINHNHPVHAALFKAERATPQHTLEQLTAVVHAEKNTAAQAAPEKMAIKKAVLKKTFLKLAVPAEDRRFKESAPVLTRVSEAQAAEVLAALVPYQQRLEAQRQHLLSFYKPVDVAFKVVGTGSVGLRDYCIYFEGNGHEDPLFLQVKEEPDSAYTTYLPEAHPPAHNGERVVLGQRELQMQSDPFLGWTEMDGRHYLVRQLNDHKGSIEMEDLAGGGLLAYAEVCGELLARGHARSADPIELAGYLGSGNGFAEAIARFGSLYADQTEKDWEQLKRSGKAKA